ncbi:extracellular solute-binding protein [Paenibacillus eucommiae]|uniref:Aldouronate transport system substrate-binding protein n=1 Tax=Paenibacillus eucommiae TaxID=1355755 RepID=A0ABS4J1Y8_9BACL|nr:extracellular solute-binding protein [Paenibacillus eucommiae]MBP1993846.1 putative aldouronate transport system substrate-binding protein [Paenibacillus eucommiae]
MLKIGQAVIIPFFILVLLLSGCRSGEEDTREITSPKTSEKVGVDKQTGEITGTQAGSKNEKFDPAITLSTVTSQNTAVKFAPGDSIDNNPWTRAYEHEYGIKIKSLWAVEEGKYTQKLNLAISSNDIPDFFMVNGIQFKQLADAGMIEDLTELYAKYASDMTKQTLAAGGDMPLKSATLNSRLMAIPFTWTARESAKMLYVRTDWLNKLGLSEPQTMEDLFKISEAFTKLDPDGNNKNDTYGLALDKEFSFAESFFNGFHAYNDLWMKDSGGTLVNSTIQPEMRNALKKLRELFQDGQIDPDFGAKITDKENELIISSRIGMFFGLPYDATSQISQNKELDPKAEWKSFPLPSIDGQPAKPQVALGVNGYWVVRKGAENAEAIFKLLDFWLNIAYDSKSEDVYYEYHTRKDGIPYFPLSAIKVYKDYANLETYYRFNEAFETNDMSQLTANDKGVVDKISKYKKGDLNNYGWHVMYTKNGGSMHTTDYYKKNNLYMFSEFVTLPLPTMVKKAAMLEKMQREAFTKIIMGKSPIEEFDNFVAQWQKLGGDEMTKEVNEWYRNNR